MLQHELCGLKARRKILVGGFLYDTRTGEADHAFGLRDVDIADGGEGGGHPSGGRMGENGDVGKLRLGKPRQRAAGLGHLHERKHALLHPCAGGCGDDDDPAFFSDGGFDGAGDFFADDRAHRAGEEFEIHDGDHRLVAADGDASGDNRVIESGFFAEACGFFGVAVEAKRIGGNQASIRLLEAVGIRKHVHALVGIHQEMVRTMRADLKVLLEFKHVDQGVAVRAFDPESFGHVFPAVIAVAEARFVENTHGFESDVRDLRRPLAGTRGQASAVNSGLQCRFQSGSGKWKSIRDGHGRTMFHAERMPKVHVDLADRSYDVLVEHGLLARAGETMLSSGLPLCRAAVISDQTVAGFHAEALMASLGAAGFHPTLHTVPAGEGSKSMTHVEKLCREMIRSGHDRKSMVVALGGGVVGDLAGFVAAIFYRGIPFVQIPTTIVSQVDSSVGGKTGVNVAEGKNLLGAFHQPSLVLVDPVTLATLAEREYCEGFAEAIKHAAIRDAGMMDELAALDPAGREVPADLLARNIAIKARIVEQDEYETKDVRALLNFGHTIGHGIEAAVPYGRMLHGEAIALGLRAALFLSEKHAGLDAAAGRRVVDLLEKFKLPLVLPEEITTDTVMNRLARDKKFNAGAVRFVVIDALGSARVTKDITAEDLREAVEFLRGK